MMLHYHPKRYNYRHFRTIRNLDFYLAPGGVARYCFHPLCLSVCLSVCVCVSVCPARYFGIVKVTGTVHCFLKVQTYHKN